MLFICILFAILPSIFAYNWTDSNCATSLSPFNHSLVIQSAASFVEIVTAYNYTTYVIYTNPAQPFSYRITNDNRDLNTAKDSYSLDGCAHGTVSIATMNPLPLHLAVECSAANNVTCHFSFSYTAQFVCFPNCTKRACGSDDCGGTCGSGCGSGLYCAQNHTCLVDNESPTASSVPQQSETRKTSGHGSSDSKGGSSHSSKTTEGIASGVVCGVFFFALVAVYIIRRRRQDSTRKDEEMSTNSSSPGWMSGRQ